MKLEQALSVLKSLYRNGVMDSTTLRLILYNLMDRELQTLDKQKERDAAREAAARADGTVDDQIPF